MTLAQKLENLPTNPGCYLYRDGAGAIIYVGKAVNLRSRVRSYFHKSADHAPKTRRLVSHIADLEWIATDSELEALILECNLIKKHKPKYNIRLRDDKHYPYLQLTTSEPFPRLLITRRVKRGDGDRYFGPYTNSHAVHETLRLIYRLFPLVTCRKRWTNTEGQKPCLYHHMGRCPEAPCANLADRGRYWQAVKDVELFLSGRQDRLVHELERQMEAAAEDLQFERAARLRDQVSAIKTIAERQKVVDTTQGDQDVVAVVNDEGGACVQMFFIRGGKLIGQEHFLLEGADADRGLEEATAEFVKQYYQDASFVPSEILLPAHVEEMEIIESWLRQKKGAKVTISVPERGGKRHLVEMAATNARLALEQIQAQSSAQRDRADTALRELARALELPEDNLLTRIEAYDISNVQGRHAVGGMIVFERGQPKKSEYRRFKISQEGGEPNDFAMMYEVLTRRFNQMAGDNPKFAEEPDLILIDGGKGQLSAARDAMRQFGYDFPMIGLAKQFEFVFLPGRGEPLELGRSSPALFLLQRVRDEVHRYALAYHRSVRGRAARRSVLDEIPGIGPARRRALLKCFGSVEKMRQASAVDLAAAPGMNSRTARDVWEYLRGL